MEYSKNYKRQWDPKSLSIRLHMKLSIKARQKNDILEKWKVFEGEVTKAAEACFLQKNMTIFQQ